MKTVGLELAKQLKEAGFPQESDFWYDKQGDDHYLRYRGDAEQFTYAAPTAEEILDLLPEIVGEYGKPGCGGLTVSKYKDGYAVWYCSAEDRTSLFGPTLTVYEDSLAEASAKMYLYLKKEGLLPTK